MVRAPLTIPDRPRRAPEEHLAARVPGLFSWLARSVGGLQPESRIRHAVIWRSVEQGLSATNRRDFAVVLPRYDPDVEILPARELHSVGIAARYHGREGFLRLWNDWDSAWAGHAQWGARELIDVGDRLIMVGTMTGTGGASGIALDTQVAVVWTLKAGRVIREEHYMEPKEALKAVGLEPSGATAGRTR